MKGNKMDNKADAPESKPSQDMAEEAKHDTPVHAQPAEPRMLRARGMHQGEMHVGELKSHKLGAESSMTDKMAEGNVGSSGAAMPSLDFRLKRGEQKS
jgi:hypothetical protein